MPKKYIVRLKAEEREQLLELIQKGKAAAKTLTHARILLKTDCADGHIGWTDKVIREALDVSVATIERGVAHIFVTDSLPRSTASLAHASAPDDSMAFRKRI